MIRRVLLCAAALSCLALVGCSDDAADGPVDQGSDVTTPTQPVDGSLVVLADPAVAPTMEAAIPAFEEANPDATATVESLPTADIVARAQAGTADVVALVDAAAMDELEGAGVVAAVVRVPAVEGARAGAVVASANPRAATRFVELAGA